MSEETIKAIIAVEKEIQARGAAEEIQISQWLARQEAAVALEAEEGMKALRLQQAEEEGREKEEVERQAAAILAAAEREARQFREISAADLEALLGRHLKRILPG